MAEMKEVLSKVLGKRGEPISTYKINFQSQQNQLEPIYYWVLDFIYGLGFKEKDVKKVTDNFTASPGSGQFTDFTSRSTKLQEDGMRMLGSMNQVIKSILNLLYDLKEFEIRLQHYKDSRSKDKDKKTEGILALKNIWLDSVDLKKGGGSIHQMTAQLGYTTLREAFMVANNQEDLKKMADEKTGVINQQVYRILVPRLNDFLSWVDYSEKELNKRFNIEKAYLKSQVETVKLYSSWLKPYLKAVKELRQKGFEGSASLVNAFSTTMFELVLFAKKEQKAPDKFSHYNSKRKYYSCVMATMKFRGELAQRQTQRGDYGFVYGGKLEMVFDAYALNEEELGLVEKQMKSEDFVDSYSALEDTAGVSLEQLKEDLDHFLKSPEEVNKELLKKIMKDQNIKGKPEELGQKKAEELLEKFASRYQTDFGSLGKKEEKVYDANPFVELFGLIKWMFGGLKKEPKKEIWEINKSEDIKPDNFYEKEIRTLAEDSAHTSVYTLYDVYKKAHGMVSSPGEMKR